MTDTTSVAPAADTSSIASPIVTTNFAEFRKALQDGDILLFHTLRDISQLIRFVDNSPVNHCALYRKKGKTIPDEDVIVHASTHAKGERAVREESLRRRLEGDRDRTVTALRRPGKTIASDVFAVADVWLANETRYGYKDLPSLGAHCIMRSYGNDEDRSEIAKAVLVNASRVTRLSARRGDPKLSVTCSEFVYTCYIAAVPDSIEIRDPLAYVRNGRPRGVNVVTRGGKPVFQLIGRKRPSSASRLSLTFRGPGGVCVAAPSLAPQNPHSLKGILTREMVFTLREARENYAEGKNIPPAHQTPEPYAQAVTPFDLWQSPSLTIVKVFHRPPGPGDKIWEHPRGQVSPHGSKVKQRGRRGPK